MRLSTPIRLYLASQVAAVALSLLQAGIFWEFWERGPERALERLAGAVEMAAGRSALRG